MIEVDASDIVGRGGGRHCAYEHILDYTNNPENILTLILHSFIRSLSNSRSCQIKPIFPILLFGVKLKHTCKCVKMALKYQITKREGFFFQHSLKCHYSKLMLKLSVSI